MLTINVRRYYGNPYITKSIVTIENGKGKVLFSGEGREVGYKDYEKGEKISDGSRFCLGEGEYLLKEASARGMRLCWKITDDTKHRGFKLACIDEERQNIEGFLNIGYTENLDAPFRRLKDIENAKKRIIAIIEHHFGDVTKMIVSNMDVEEDFTDTAGDFCQTDDDWDDDDWDDDDDEQNETSEF